MLPRVTFLTVLIATSTSFAGVDVKRFATGTEQPGTAWIGKTLSDALAADLVDLQNPLGAEVIGTYQAINNQIRVNVQVLDHEGKLIGATRASGTTDELFHLEDALAESTRALIAKSIRQHANATAAPSNEDRTPTRLSYSGPLKRNVFASSGPKITDPSARAATWRYYYSSPLFNCSWNYCGYGYGYHGHGYGYGYGYRFGGRPAFIFAAY